MTFSKDMVDENKLILAHAKKILTKSGYSAEDERDLQLEFQNSYTRMYIENTLIDLKKDYPDVSSERLRSRVTAAIRQLRGDARNEN